MCRCWGCTRLAHHCHPHNLCGYCNDNNMECRLLDCRTTTARPCNWRHMCACRRADKSSPDRRIDRRADRAKANTGARIRNLRTDLLLAAAYTDDTLECPLGGGSCAVTWCNRCHGPCDTIQSIWFPNRSSTHDPPTPQWQKYDVTLPSD